MRISRSPLPAHIRINKEQPVMVEYFIYEGSVIRNDAKCTGEIKCDIVMPRNSVQRESGSFHKQIGIKFRKKTVKCYIWSIVLCGAETGTVLHVERSFVWC